MLQGELIRKQLGLGWASEEGFPEEVRQGGEREKGQHRVPVWRNPADGRRSGLGGALSPDGGVSPHFSFSPGPWTVSTVQNYKGFHSDLVLSRSWNHFS